MGFNMEKSNKGINKGIFENPEKFKSALAEVIEENEEGFEKLAKS